VKIFLIVEGDSDKIIINSQNSWFNNLGLHFNIITTGGKINMIKTASKHYNMAIIQNAKNVIYLPDQNNDECPLITRKNIGVDNKKGAKTIVLKRELEAWILADSKCIRNSINIQYAPAGQTDKEINPKEKLHSMIENKLGYSPTTLEAATLIAPHFSINRASNYNTSAKRFKEYIENISRLC
jgi:hypothetical protein